MKASPSPSAACFTAARATHRAHPARRFPGLKFLSLLASGMRGRRRCPWGLMRGILVLTLVLAAGSGAFASCATSQSGSASVASVRALAPAPDAGQTSTTAPAERVIPSGPYPVLFTLADAAEQQRARAAFIKSNPGWQASAHASGRFFTASPPAPVASLGTEGGARAFIGANAAALGIDAAVFTEPTVQGDERTFGVSAWGRYRLGGFTVSPRGAAGVFLGPLDRPPRELDDETLTRLVVGRRFDYRVETRTTPRPCDPAPHGGCPSGAPEASEEKRSLLIERRHVRRLEHKVLGVTRPNDPEHWELRLVVAFTLDLQQECRQRFGQGEAHTDCRFRLEVDGKPAREMVFDAVTGEPLFERALVLQVASTLAP